MALFSSSNKEISVKMETRNFKRLSVVHIALVLVSFMLALGVAEVGLRMAHYGEASRTPLEKLMEYDPLLGWQHKQNFSARIVTDEYQTIIHYNANRLADSGRSSHTQQAASRLVVLGDSFVDGYTVPAQDVVTAALEALLPPQFEVINLGVVGYSTDQELLLLEREGWTYQPDLVVLAFYYNDVWANGSRYLANSTTTQKPVFVLDADGNLNLTNVPVPYPQQTLHERFKLYDLIRNVVKGNHLLYSLALEITAAHGNPSDNSSPAPTGAAGGAAEFKVYRKTETPELTREWTITQALLRRMKHEIEQRGARFVVFYVPTRIELSPEEWSSARLPPDYDPGTVARKLALICATEDIPYIDPSDRFREAQKRTPLYLRRDPHWNAAGHHLAAKILAEYIQSSWQGTHR